MAWTTPPTFYSGTVVTASNLNILSSDLTYLKGAADGSAFYGVKLIRSTNLSTSTGSPATYIPWSSEVFDVGSWWSTGDTITVPAAAVPTGYSTVALFVSATVQWASNGTGSRGVGIAQTGATVEYFATSAISGDNTTVVLTTLLPAVAGDTLRFTAYQSSGGALNVVAARLSIARLGPIS